MLIEGGTYNVDLGFVVIVQYFWMGSPRQDFTVKVHSVDGNPVHRVDYSNGGRMTTNMRHADGQSPSEFDHARVSVGASRPGHPNVGDSATADD